MGASQNLLAAEKKRQSAELHEKNKEAWGVSGKNARDLSPLGPQDLDEELKQGIAEGEIAVAQARKNLRDFNQANPPPNLREAARTHAKNLREAAIVLQIDVIADKKRQFAELHERNRAAWGVPGNNAGPQDLDEEGASCFT